MSTTEPDDVRPHASPAECFQQLLELMWVAESIGVDVELPRDVGMDNAPHLRRSAGCGVEGAGGRQTVAECDGGR
eukprot:1772097-Prymnesium_polylepis.1